MKTALQIANRNQSSSSAIAKKWTQPQLQRAESVASLCNAQTSFIEIGNKGFDGSRACPVPGNRDMLAIHALAHVLVGESVSTPDQVRGRLSPRHAPAAPHRTLPTASPSFAATCRMVNSDSCWISNVGNAVRFDLTTGAVRSARSSVICRQAMVHLNPFSRNSTTSPPELPLSFDGFARIDDPPRYLVPASRVRPIARMNQSFKASTFGSMGVSSGQTK